MRPIAHLKMSFYKTAQTQLVLYVVDGMPVLEIAAYPVSAAVGTYGTLA